MEDQNTIIEAALAIAEKAARGYAYVNTDDLVQDVAVVIMSTDMATVHNVPAWTRGVVRNVARTTVRQDRRQNGLVPDRDMANGEALAWCSVTRASLEALGIEVAGCGPGDVAEDVALTEALGRAFAALRDDDKSVVPMLLAGFTAREVAEQFGMKVAAAKKRVERARKRFAALAADELGK